MAYAQSQAPPAQPYAQPLDMDDFTPPPPSNLPPPLPPPPSDLPRDYRATSPTDTMRGVASSRGSIEVPPASPTQSQPGRSRRGSFGFLTRTRSKSRSREVPTVTAPNGQTMLRKQKLHDHEEHLRQKREARAAQPPVSYTHLTLPTKRIV